MLETIQPRWDDFCIVAATGPSLTPEVAEACRGHHVVAVKDAWRRLPFAEVLYAVDRWWIEHFEGCPEYGGEKWSSHSTRINEKFDLAEKYGFRLVAGAIAEGLSVNPALIHYGSNSGFQGINMALHFLSGPRKRIALVGFDMQEVNGQGHFFGDHPGRQHRGQYKGFIKEFDRAAETLPDGVEIINCTENSALTCFPKARLEDVLADA